MLKTSAERRGGAAHAQPSADVATLRVIPPMTRLAFRCRSAAIEAAERALGLSLPRIACRASVAEDLAALWLGPDEWLILCSERAGNELIASAKAALAAIPHAFVDVSHGSAGLLVEGAQAPLLLNHGCPLDLSLSEFPVGMCTRTVLGKAEIVLWRTAEDSFRVEMRRSYETYVWSLLQEAQHDTAMSTQLP